MAVGVQPICPCKTNASPALIVNTANTNTNGTGTITTVLTAGKQGARIVRILLKATGVTTAGMLRIFVKVSAGTYRIVGEVAVAAVPTPGASTPTWEGVWTPSGGPLELDPDCVLGISTHNAEEFTALANAGDY